MNLLKFVTNLRLEIERKILHETKVSREHLTPELSLHLITPDCPLFHAPISDASDRIFREDPFWGFYWPGGQALSRYILDNVGLVQNKSVLDVGSGCGASSLAAIKRGAKYALANDIDEVAGVAVHLNAALNRVPRQSVKICAENLIESVAAVAEDVILLGDVFYDEEFAGTLIPWLQRLRRDGKTILVGDPGRHPLTAPPRLALMKKVATYELSAKCCIENNGFKSVNVWIFN